jgi:hypothetical protein
MTSWHVVASISVFLTACLGQAGQGDDAWLRLRQIDKVLQSAHASGSLVYQGYCGRNLPEAPPVQALVDYSGPPIETLQKMFAYVPHMRVTQEPGGMIRMVETDVPSDLLDVKISHLSLGPITLKPAEEPPQTTGDRRMALHWPGQPPVNPNFTFRPWIKRTRELGGSGIALELILNTSEVSAFKKANNIRPFSTGGFLLPGNSGSSPPVKGKLDNVTLSQALDYMLGTFPGFWVYENCVDEEGDRRVRFSFFERVP